VKLFDVTAPFLICEVPTFETAKAVPPSATNSDVIEIGNETRELLILPIIIPFRLSSPGRVFQ
jgi:hypothetical protein